jgi:uncharacterized membrane protein
MVFVLEIIVIALASCGFTLAFYIHSTKQVPGQLVCPLEGSCDHVVHSDYGKLLGVPVEGLGMIYYLAVGLLYTFFAFGPEIVPAFMQYAVVGISITSFLFSLYLTSIQAFVLKHWCTWCLFSALICTVILVLTLYISGPKAIDFLNVFWS